MNVLQASTGDFTEVEMNVIERILYNSCYQSLARKRDSLKNKIIFVEHFSSGSISLVPDLSLLKYLDMTLAGHKSLKIKGSGPFGLICFYYWKQ